MILASRRLHGRLAHPDGPLVTIAPFVDEGLGNSSYLVEIGDGRGLVVDPTPDVSPLRSQAGLRRRLARGAACSAANHLGTELGVGGPANVLPGVNQGLHLVDDGDHKDRPRRPGPARMSPFTAMPWTKLASSAVGSRALRGRAPCTRTNIGGGSHVLFDSHVLETSTVARVTHAR